MSWYAFGYGHIVVREDLTEEDLLKLYPHGEAEGTVSIFEKDYHIPDVMSLIKVILDNCSPFEEISRDDCYPHEQGRIVLELRHERKNYREESVTETLRLLAPVCVQGHIDFEGEDDTYWAFHFSADENEFLEWNGKIVYDGENRTSLIGYMNFSQTAVLHAVRRDGLEIEQDVTVMVYHRSGLDVLKAIDACLVEWFKTPEGKEAWSQSSCDYNIGDWLCGAHPDDMFTSFFGFILDPGHSDNVIEIDYDRILGDHEETEEEEADPVSTTHLPWQVGS